LSIHALPFLKQFLKPPRRHADEQHAGLRPDILEGVRGSSRNEHNGLSGRGHDAVAEFDLELSAHNVEELILGLVNVGRRATVRRDRLPEHAKRSPGLICRCQKLGEVLLPPLRSAEFRRAIR
jgi:hypothetical protein